MKYLLFLIGASFMFIIAGCSGSENRKSPFTITETDQTLQLKEGNGIVFVYRKMPNSLTGQYVCNNYIHPLYNLHGDVMTEEFPPDHPYHRGIFWAWHQLYADGKRLGDGWTNDSISQDVAEVKSETLEDRVMLKLNVLWKSKVYGDGKPFMDEKTTITVHKLDSGLRKIDFEIRLTAMAPHLQIGGAPDQKGYGGFCVRLNLSDSLVFTSENGPVKPTELQIKAGPWMDISGKFSAAPSVSGITILCHPVMPDYPEPWILRQKTSMQNIVFPGNGRIDVPVNKPLVLQYRLVVHDGDAHSLNIPWLQEEYARVKFSD
jgi:hypothetical protein